MSLRARIFLKVDDWTWWVWLLTATLLFVGLAGHAWGFVAAMALTVAAALALLARDRGERAFAVQLRLAYLLLLLLCWPPVMRWLYWLPALGTVALVVFGYCLLARVLSLLPWNSHEPYTLDRLRRTFLSAPDPSRVRAGATTGCAGGMCTIEAQVAPAPISPLGGG